MLAAWEELGNFNDVDDLRRHYHVTEEVWQAFEAQVGSPSGDVRLLAALPPAAVIHGVQLARLPDQQGFTAMQATQVGLVWRLARKVVHHLAGMGEEEFQDEDPWRQQIDTRPTLTAPQSSGGGGGVKTQVLKMASLIDQSDESELLPATQDKVDGWIQNYVVVMGSQPAETEEPTAPQLAALDKRVHSNLQAPYCDFAVWVPFERRMAKVQKCRTFIPLGDGSFLQRDLPGPGSYLAWRACWGVFRTACLMLNVATLAALEGYARHIEKLSIQWPGCWGLIYSADDLARAERMERTRRMLSAEASRGRQVPVDWDPVKPWTCVLNVLVKDVEFWSEKVHQPASAWLAAGARGSPVIATEAAILNAIPGGSQVLGAEDDEKRSSKRQANKDRREAKKKRAAAERDELRRLRDGGGGKPGPKGRGKGKTKSKDQAGTPLCYSWASGVGVCADVPPGGECKGEVKRAHKCRICLSPSHRDSECTAR